jgi:protein-histidine pros-kinase
MKFSLATKFNAVFLAVFAVGFVATSVVTNVFLQQSAREETLQKARVLMAAAEASSVYTSMQIAPLLESRLKFEFVPQSIPWFAASEQLNHLLKAYPDYTYKEATLNPTNPRDRASNWEAALVNDLRAKPGTEELVGERTGPVGQALYIAKPIQIKEAACLACHSTPEAAPKTILDTYGPLNGFGWKLNETIGAQVVSVPMALPLQRAAATLHTYMLSMLGVFVFLFCALNVAVHLFVTRRLRRMSALADRVSLGDADVEEIDLKGSDELSLLARSFGRMRTSLASAMKMLEE